MNPLRTPRLGVVFGLVVVLIAGTMVAAERSAARMATAASAFLDSLTPEQRAEAVFGLQSDERLRWNFIPTEMFPRRGLTIGAMNDAQRARAHDLLRAGLSQRGYLTAAAVMDLETILREIESGGRLDRDPETYFFHLRHAHG